INEVSKLPEVPKAMWADFVKVLSPYAPHLGEELWEKLGNKETIAYVQWPTFNEEFLKDDSKEIVVMVNGKKRDTFEAAPGTADDVLKETALSREAVKKFTDGHEIVKCIIVKDKLVNLVVK
ncbi:MAG: class I tRNA ligase family protein, partial [Treponema sp.]|nr:class I tRNA ligase family protein [Treponema sp.]